MSMGSVTRLTITLANQFALDLLHVRVSANIDAAKERSVLEPYTEHDVSYPVGSRQSSVRPLNWQTFKRAKVPAWLACADYLRGRIATR